MLGEMYKLNIRGKLYKLLYELNKDRRISVRTPIGESEQKETKEGISQGSIDAGSRSLVNLRKGVDEFFNSSEEEIMYGNVKILPQQFQDDLVRCCVSQHSAQEGLNRLENLANSKLLSFKGCFNKLEYKKLDPKKYN